VRAQAFADDVRESGIRGAFEGRRRTFRVKRRKPGGTRVAISTIVLGEIANDVIDSCELPQEALR